MAYQLNLEDRAVIDAMAMLHIDALADVDLCK